MKFDETSKRLDVDLPGPLQCDVVMTLHSREAYKLFAGRQQVGDKANNKDFSVNNLKKFAKKMNAIWFAAQNNDPFADWCLYRIEQKMEEIESLMTAEQMKLEELLKCASPLQINSALSVKPVNITLSFANPFTYQTADLIAQYDKLACMALAADHIRFNDRGAKNAYIYTPAKRIRKLFMMASDWKPSRVTRDTYDPATADTRKAEAAMGILPKAFLDKSLRAKISPYIRTSTCVSNGPK